MSKGMVKSYPATVVERDRLGILEGVHMMGQGNVSEFKIVTSISDTP
jgi:hypothetical protein